MNCVTRFAAVEPIGLGPGSGIARAERDTPTTGLARRVAGGFGASVFVTARYPGWRHQYPVHTNPFRRPPRVDDMIDVSGAANTITKIGLSLISLCSNRFDPCFVNGHRRYLPARQSIGAVRDSPTMLTDHLPDSVRLSSFSNGPCYCRRIGSRSLGDPDSRRPQHDTGTTANSNGISVLANHALNTSDPAGNNHKQ